MAAAASARPQSGTSAQTEPSAGLKSLNVRRVAVLPPPNWLSSTRGMSGLLVRPVVRSVQGGLAKGHDGQRLAARRDMLREDRRCARGQRRRVESLDRLRQSGIDDAGAVM